MTIKVGDRLPDAKFTVMGADGPAAKTDQRVFAGKKVALFAVPGAYTPTCSKDHMPGFVDRVDELKGKGIDTIACTAVNDIFVLTIGRRTPAPPAKSKCWRTAPAISPRRSASTSICRASAWGCAPSATRCWSTTASSRPQRRGQPAGRREVERGQPVLDDRPFTLELLGRSPRAPSAGLNGAIARRASSSARSFSGCPAWPLSQCHVDVMLVAKRVELLP